MNDRQAMVACVAGVLVLLSGLFPPWRLTVREALPANVTPHTFYAQQEVWTGYAFGFGTDRLAMGKYAIPDIRMLFENDLRFLKQL